MSLRLMPEIDTVKRGITKKLMNSDAGKWNEKELHLRVFKGRGEGHPADCALALCKLAMVADGNETTGKEMLMC